MNLIFAKLFEDYIRKRDDARFNITLYISIFYFLLTFSIILPIKTFIDKKVFNNQLHYKKSTIMIVVFGLLAAITFLVYYIYIKKNYIQELMEKHKSKRINKTTLYLIVTMVPVTLLLLAGTITVFLNGGKILGNEIKGLLQ